MANYYAKSRTNYFRVTDEARYAELFQNLCTCGDCVDDFTKVVDGVTIHAFGGYGSIEYVIPATEDEDEENNFDLFLEELQKILPADDAFILMECGNEKLRYLTAFAIIATKDKVEYVDLSTNAVNKAAEMLGIEDFETRLEY